jgi:hypothetical protein
MIMNKPSHAGQNNFDFTKALEVSKETSREKFPTPPDAIPSRPRVGESYFNISPASDKDDSGTEKNHK